MAALWFAAKPSRAALGFIPLARMIAMAVWRSRDRLAGALAERTRQASSPKTTSSTQWCLFSMAQWFRASASSASEPARSGARLVMA